MKDSNQVFHDGELEAQRRFGDIRLSQGLAQNIRSEMSHNLVRFLMEQPFFFLSTANDNGDCDCSFRGREHNRPHDPEPLVLALDAKTLLFPDFPGNGYFNSIGNILTNPKVGMLFVDFTSATRVRINGRASIHEDLGECKQYWPKAARMIKVQIDQVYPNCRARIPKMSAS